MFIRDEAFYKKNNTLKKLGLFGKSHEALETLKLSKLHHFIET